MAASPGQGLMDSFELLEIWVYLAESPLLGLTLTLLAYIAGVRCYQASGGNPLVNPVAIAIIIIMLCLALSGTAFQTYFEGAQFVHFLLGPATVAFAVPLYQQLGRLRALALPMFVGVLGGVLAGTASSVVLARLLGASTDTALSLAPKSMTTPIAMGVSEHIGGLPSLTAVLVISTGIIGASFGTRLFALLRIEDDAVKGIAMGLNAHGIGTARAFQVSPQMGAFSGLGMALMAFIGPLIVPSLLSFLGFLD
ncbi:LrgB family protein [Granulosicoccaceae sp. 1_MG-2023]|nr:LrgB family protein [Granulosicoccaceae sp. 1_MG-2023]